MLVAPGGLLELRLRVLVGRLLAVLLLGEAALEAATLRVLGSVLGGSAPRAARLWVLGYVLVGSGLEGVGSA